MPVVLQIIGYRPTKLDQLSWDIKIAQGADQVILEDDLIRELTRSNPDSPILQKGIVRTQRITQTHWMVYTHK